MPSSFVKSRVHYNELDNTLICQFCGSSNVDKKTWECRDCGTVKPRNYGPGQRKDRHGRDLPELKKPKRKEGTSFVNL